MRILVLRGGALGDFVVTCPALQALRNRWPRAEIHLVGNARAAELGRDSGLLDHVHSQHEGRWAALYLPHPLSPDLSQFLSSFDLALSFWPDPEQTIRTHLSALVGTCVFSHAHVETAPAAKHFCDALREIGIAACDYFTPLVIPESERLAAEALLGANKPYLAVHPGSGSPRKNWPLDRWRELAVRSGLPVLCITGEADTETTAWPAQVYVTHARQWPLPTLGAALKQCVYYVGHDTGISHFAAAVGARSLLLFGPTDPQVWAPPAAHVAIIKAGDDMGAISVDAVLARLKAQLAHAGLSVGTEIGA